MIFDEPYFAYSDVGAVHSGKTSFLTYEEAVELNKQKYAIAIIPNLVVGGRTDKHVTKVRAWFCDIDYEDAPKVDLDDLLQSSPLIPTYVVESKNGYHLYFLTKYLFNPNYRYTTQLLGIIEYFGGDEKCKNHARLLRAPGFIHNKSDPFEVKIVFESEARYSEGQIESAFPYFEDEQEDESVDAVPTSIPKLAVSESWFDKIRHYNSRVILQALSGTSAVAGKNYRFKPMTNGHYNIVVNGKDSGCFINEKGNVIGSPEYSGGAVEWLRYYGHSRVDALRIIKGVMGWE